MRELKFRAKTNDGDTFDGWVYSDTHGLSDFFHGIETGRYDESTLGQYTGLIDKAGILIYEGDIVGLFGNEDIEAWDQTGIIKYFDTICAFTPTDEEGENMDWDDIMVLGNIYKNPKLLKK